jgi:hypothetical protein
MKKRTLRVFLKLFTTSTLGLGLGLGQCRRPTNEQSSFRQNLILAYNATDDSKDLLWCPLTGDWRDSTTATASYIFPWKHEEDTMVALFGKSSKNEMFSPRNGLILANQVEALFESGLFVIVPDIEDETKGSIEKWNAQSPKEYKLRVINPQHPKAQTRVMLDKEGSWLDWDGRKLKFRNSFRPRAKYLYFHYWCQMLRYAWSSKKDSTDRPTPLRHELKKQFWGTSGRYLPRNMLLALVDEMGHQYDDLIKGAIDVTCKPDQEDLLLGAITKQILSSNNEEEEDDDDNQYEEVEEDSSSVAEEEEEAEEDHDKFKSNGIDSP